MKKISLFTASFLLVMFAYCYGEQERPLLLGVGDGWIRNEKNLITNFYSMYQPEVIYIKEWDDGDRSPYLMWFFAWAYTSENTPLDNYPGFPGSDAIFLARAKSLEGPWDVYAQKHDTGEKFWDTIQNPYSWYPVLTCQDVWYDNYHVGDPSIVYMNPNEWNEIRSGTNPIMKAVDFDVIKLGDTYWDGK